MSALKWAVRVNVIAKRPDPPPLPSSLATKKTRGRPLAGEELERMALKLPKLVPKECAARCEWNLEGLWRSGFRLGETFVFYWEPKEGMHYIENLDGDRPRIAIDESGEKGHQNRTIPMAPDFAAMLRAVDPKKRRGPVFRWPLSTIETRNVKTVAKRISELGHGAAGRRDHGYAN